MDSAERWSVSSRCSLMNGVYQLLEEFRFSGERLKRDWESMEMLDGRRDTSSIGNAHSMSAFSVSKLILRRPTETGTFQVLCPGHMAFQFIIRNRTLQGSPRKEQRAGCNRTQRTPISFVLRLRFGFSYAPYGLKPSSGTHQMSNFWQASFQTFCLTGSRRKTKPAPRSTANGTRSASTSTSSRCSGIRSGSGPERNSHGSSGTEK
jgi:hypothetical protein